MAVPAVATAQSSKIDPDSLAGRLATTPPGDERVKLLYDLCIHYVKSDMPRATAYSIEAVSLVNRNTPLSLRGNVWYSRTVTTMTIDSGIYYVDKAIADYTSAADSVNLAESYNMKAEILADYGRYTEALPYYQNALDILMRHGRTTRAAYAISNIALVYHDMYNTERSVEYSLRALEMFREAGDTNGIASTLIGMTEYYFSINDTAKVFETIEEEIALYRHIGKPFLEAYVMSNKADALMDYRQDYDGALRQLFTALTMCDTTSANRTIHINILRKIARAYFFKDRPDKSLDYALRAVAATDSSNRVMVMYNELLLLYIYIELSDSEKALASLERYRSLSEEMHSAQIESGIADMQVKYETLKKENQILVLGQEKRRSRVLLILLSSLFAVAMVIAFLLLRSWNDRRRIAEQRLRLIATESVIEGAEKERRRMARDLHDGLGGLLTGLRFTLNSVKGTYITTSRGADDFDKAIDLLDESIGELRRVARNMMPEALMRLGLNAALEDFCSSLNTDNRSSITFVTYGEVFRVPARYETGLYRIAQELVNNALRHSGASTITVQLIYDTPRVHLTVSDDGCGFDASAPATGTGLAGIRSRCESLGGTFTIDTAPDAGTEVSAGFTLVPDDTTKGEESDGI